jgi:enamidase
MGMTGTLLVHGASTIVTGTLAAPRTEGDAVLIEDGIIRAVGRLDDVHPGGSVPSVDVNGATLAPGLIDPHTHPVLGDFTPRQSTVGWITSYLNGGVTSLVSAGETHWPGRPRTAAGTKAVAIAACQSAANLRPGGAKLMAGALLLEPGLTDDDFADMHDAGVRLLGEIGLGAVVDPDELRPLVTSARERGWTVPMHIGGASVPGSHVLGAAAAIAVQPDVASHTNGGPTARPFDEIVEILDGTAAAIEVVQAGNIRALADIVRLLRERDAVDRLQIGTDTPSGTGVVPLGMLRTLAYCVALGGLEPDIALCCATGVTAVRYGLDTGRLAPGYAGDLVAFDAPVGGTTSAALDALRAGDTLGIGLVVVDGEILVTRSRVTPPPIRTIILDKPAVA